MGCWDAHAPYHCRRGHVSFAVWGGEQEGKGEDIGNALDGPVIPSHRSAIFSFFLLNLLQLMRMHAPSRPSGPK